MQSPKKASNNLLTEWRRKGVAPLKSPMDPFKSGAVGREWEPVDDPTLTQRGSRKRRQWMAKREVKRIGEKGAVHEGTREGVAHHPMTTKIRLD